MHLKTIAAGLVAAGALALVPAAQADASSPYLSKQRAYFAADRIEERIFQNLADEDPDLIDRGVERPSACERLSSRVVDCEAWMYYDGGITCWDTVRVTLSRYGTTRWSYPYRPDCG